MKKLLLTFIMAVAVITAKAVTSTVYVQADEAPFIYAWFTINSVETKINGGWPGKQLTEKVKKTNKNGEEIEFWCQTFNYPETPSFNIIFNNGGEDPKTADFKFENGGYYDATGLLGNVKDGTQSISTPATQFVTLPTQPIYNLQGQRVSGSYRGIVISQGRKVMVK